MSKFQGYGPIKGLRVDSDSEDEKVYTKKTGGPAQGGGKSLGAMDQMLGGMFNPKPIPKKDPPPEKKKEVVVEKPAKVTPPPQPQPQPQVSKVVTRVP